MIEPYRNVRVEHKNIQMEEEEKVVLQAVARYY